MLDEASFTLGELNLSRLIDQLDQWERYPRTDMDERHKRLENATILVINKVRLEAELIAALPKLKLVLLTATGTDNVDLQACRAQGITVCNVTNYGNASVAQHVMSLILALSTNLLAYAKETAGGAWSSAQQFSTLKYPITELDGKVLGIVGYGALAKEVEKFARAFGMDILISQRPGGAPQPGRVAFDELLSKVDVLSLHCPLVKQTHQLINAAAFKQMRTTAILINTARGAIVDNAALAIALQGGEIRGAGIDVLEREPPAPDHPLLQADIPNLIITPHVAWAAVEARQRLLDKVAENLAAWLAGSPINVVN